MLAVGCLAALLPSRLTAWLPDYLTTYLQATWEAAWLAYYLPSWSPGYKAKFIYFSGSQLPDLTDQIKLTTLRHYANGLLTLNILFLLTAED